MMTLADIARALKMSWETVKAILKSKLERTYKYIDLKGVRRIAIDEIHIGREMRDGRKRGRFLTLVIDLESGRILHVAKGRGANALEKFFRRLRLARVRIEAVSCDMAAGYWSAVLKHLKTAALVFDRFHIVKLMNERIDDIRRGLQREASALGRSFLKGVRFLLFMRGENVPEHRQKQLNQALEFNQPLATAYYLKERLLALWECPIRSLMEMRLRHWIEDALATGMPALVKMAATLRMHAEQILNYADHPITSGKMEGINNKIKTLNRSAYGYRDLHFFTLRLYDLHNSGYKLI